MALAAGTKIGPYEILSPLGAGGMGEVYRAHDSRLGRDVAIKVLPTNLSSDPSLRQRLEREAKAVSKLSHPHICTLHDIGHQDGMVFLVMELVEGDTLEQRLSQAPLPPEQTIRYGAEIADALARAHKLGFTHRDLKPSNIMLTKSGAKLMDFGLAKQSGPAPLTSGLTDMTAEQSRLTGDGMLVGTFQYMAPEQLEGKEADARTDIFALGEVLYEMATGKPAFSGKSRAGLIASILTTDPPPITQLQPLTPAALERVVKKCLAKDPDERWQSASDLASELGWIAASGSGTAVTTTPAFRRSKAVLLALAAGFLVMAAIGLAAWWRQTPEARRVTRSTLLPPEGMHFAPLYRNGPPSLSPDGTRMAFVATREGRSSLWLRSLDKLDAAELAGTEGAYYPFWSPDGRSIAFFAKGSLWRMDASGGAPIAICNAADARGGTWGAGNDILLTADSITVLRVAASGGTPVRASPTRWNAVGESDRWPFFLPDGKHFLYMHSPTGSADDRNEIHFASVDGKTNKVLLKGRYYVPEYALGWLLVGRSGTLVAQRLDPANGELSGDPVQVVDKLQVDDNVGTSVFSASQNGTLVYQQGSGRGGMQHFWVDATGKQPTQISELGVYGATRISPDGGKVATQVFEQAGEVNIWLLDLSGGTRFRVSSGGNADTPVWSPDGLTIYYAYAPTGEHLQIYQRPTNGSSVQRVLFASASDSLPEDVSGDGKWLLYQEALHDAPQYSALKAFPLAAKIQPMAVLDRIDFGSTARLMPGSDGWLAYQSSETGRPEVYLTRFPNAGARYQVSLSGGVQPVWSKDGKRLYFLDASQRLTEVDIKADNDAVQVSASKTLFLTSVMSSQNGAGYDVTREGNRFLLLNWIFDTPAPLTLVMNWDVELKK